MIYSFYIYDRHCQCIYHRQYNPHEDLNKANDSDISKLLFGVLYSLKNLSSKLGDNESFNSLKSFSTTNFRIHYLETLSNFKFILISDNMIDNLQNILWELYSNYFRNNIVLNPLSPIDFNNEIIDNVKFVNQTDEFIKSLSVFN